MSSRPGHRRTKADRESTSRILAAREAILDIDEDEAISMVERLIVTINSPSNRDTPLDPIITVVKTAVPNITPGEFLKVIGIAITEIASVLVAGEKHEGKNEQQG